MTVQEDEDVSKLLLQFATFYFDLFDFLFLFQESCLFVLLHLYNISNTTYMKIYMTLFCN